MFTKLRSNTKPQSDKMTATAMHKPAAAAASKATTPSRPSKPSRPAPASADRRPSFSDHQWDERQWTKPFTKATTHVVATLHFPPESDDQHDLRRIAEEENLYGKAQQQSGRHTSPKPASSPKKPSTSPASTHLTVPSKTPATAPSAKSSVSSLKSTAPSSKSSSTLSSKGSASSLWSERPSSSASNATHATSWSVDSASTVMTDLTDAALECNSNRPDSCTLGDYEVFKMRAAKKAAPKRPDSTVSSTSGTSCAGTIHSRPLTGKSSKTGDITFEVVAEEAGAIYLSPKARPTRRFR
ncbi:uncharacterized protein BKCO1_4100038 [Diplodia corticola]|uniref:Uncharacterized protein n=1 Tax=Diplodia corticola TaxID=236234 RepID=A0A1J9QVS5_9PEZI|nr:uncharacterized protein BKCO1_4100038 [Diplodia corticola]OJD32098.1 hypothetical protein BKCO1_4100038 [Diplodia corticola]